MHGAMSVQMAWSCVFFRGDAQARELKAHEKGRHAKAEKAAFAAEDKELIVAISGVDASIDVLKKDLGNPMFLQVMACSSTGFGLSPSVRP